MVPLTHQASQSSNIGGLTHCSGHIKNVVDVLVSNEFGEGLVKLAENFFGIFSRFTQKTMV